MQQVDNFHVYTDPNTNIRYRVIVTREYTFPNNTTEIRAIDPNEINALNSILNLLPRPQGNAISQYTIDPRAGTVIQDRTPIEPNKAKTIIDEYKRVFANGKQFTEIKIPNSQDPFKYLSSLGSGSAPHVASSTPKRQATGSPSSASQAHRPSKTKQPHESSKPSGSGKNERWDDSDDEEDDYLHLDLVPSSISPVPENADSGSSHSISADRLREYSSHPASGSAFATPVAESSSTVKPQSEDDDELP